MQTPTKRRPSRRAVGVGACCWSLLALATGCAQAGEPSASLPSRAPLAVPTTAEPVPVPEQAEPPAEPIATATSLEPALRAPALAVDAADLATRIAAAESLLRDGSSSDAARDQAAFDAQVLYRQLARTPDWDATVQAAVPGDLWPTIVHHIDARRTLRAMHRTLSDTLPAWRIVDPAPAEELMTYYQAGEQEFGVPWPILAAVNLVETGMGRIRGTSVAGAQGPMQFMPGTWDAFGEGDIDDPRDAIRAAARYLAHNGGGRGEIDNALFRYNNSDRYVAAVKHYATIIESHPLAFDALHRWQIVYLSAAGEAWLPTGYVETEKVDAEAYLVAHPERRLTPGPV